MGWPWIWMMSVWSLKWLFLIHHFSRTHLWTIGNPSGSRGLPWLWRPWPRRSWPCCRLGLTSWRCACFQGLVGEESAFKEQTWVLHGTSALKIGIWFNHQTWVFNDRCGKPKFMNHPNDFPETGGTPFEIGMFIGLDLITLMVKVSTQPWDKWQVRMA